MNESLLHVGFRDDPWRRSMLLCHMTANTLGYIFVNLKKNKI